MIVERERRKELYGERRPRTFREAVREYAKVEDIASLQRSLEHVKWLDPFIGLLSLERINMTTLQPYISARRADKVKARTINFGLQLVRRVLNLATEWVDDTGLTWLQSAPKIRLLPMNDRRDPYPMSAQECRALWRELPKHLLQMALFMSNTGTRDAEVCGLRWEYERKLADMGTSVFVLPGKVVKNRHDRVVVLNNTASAVIAARRGVHPTHVFGYHGHPVSRMNSGAWRKARLRAGLPEVRVHDLKHTYGHRLMCAGVELEWRRLLLGHTSTSITNHYSAADLQRLIEQSNMACTSDRDSGKTPSLVILNGGRCLRKAG